MHERTYFTDKANVCSALTPDHHRRGGAALAHALHVWRTYKNTTSSAQHVDRIAGLLELLDRFPRLHWFRGVSYLQLAGKHARWTGNEQFPGADHTDYWRVPGVRGPIVVTTFPYHWSEQTHAEASDFAERHGFGLEVRPPDVPDCWFPGQTIPIVWSRPGVEWRGLAGAAASAASAAS